MMIEDHPMPEGQKNTLLKKIILNTLREHSRVEQPRSHRGPARDIQTSPSILQESRLTDESTGALVCLGFPVPRRCMDVTLSRSRVTLEKTLCLDTDERGGWHLHHCL